MDPKHWHQIFDTDFSIQYVQEVFIPFSHLYSKLHYELGQDFLHILYNTVYAVG